MGNLPSWSFVIWVACLWQCAEMRAADPRPGALAPRLLPLTNSRVKEVSPDIERLPPVDKSVRRVSFVEPAGTLDRNLKIPGASEGDEFDPAQLEARARPMPSDSAGGRFLIDLPTAFRLADASNLLVAAARAQIAVATARAEAAGALWLPSLRGGTNYNRHDGSIQDVQGHQFDTSRSAYYAGLGAGIYGAGTPIVPGIYANFHVADALFKPLAARQFAAATNHAAVAETNDTLLRVALTYFQLAGAVQELAIADQTQSNAQQLADLTGAYAKSGEGLSSDANRAKAELSIRQLEIQRAAEAVRVSSARLAQLLRLHPECALTPADAMVPIDLPACELPLKELVAQGLSRRPELAQNRLLVAEAVARLRREQWAILMPSVVFGASYGGMGAGLGTQLAPFQDRLDFDAVAYWETRNLGFGDRAARREAQSNVQANNYRYLAVMDQIAREVVEAQAQVEYRKRQVPIARQAVATAAAAHQQNMTRIEDAKGLPIEALQSIQALDRARREHLRTLIEYNSAQFTLYRAIGWPDKLP